MARLIFEKGVVEERADLNPVTGCWRVIYEKQGEGAKFKCVLEEEQEFQDGRRGIVAVVAKPFTSGPDYIVYAVSNDKRLLLDFSKRLAHQNQLNHFDLTFSVGYHVGDPKTLIERLRAVRENDPLTRLRDTLINEIGGACAKVPWEIITDEISFDEAAAELTSPESAAFRRVQDMAHHLGMEVDDIGLSLRLLEEDVQEARNRKRHQITLAQKQRELEVTRANETIRDEEKIHQQRREMWAGGSEAITEIFKTIARGTDTVGKLRDNLDALGTVFLPHMTGPGAEAASPPDASPRLLGAQSRQPGGHEPSALQQAVGLIFQLDLRERERRSLLSAAYHLAGEMLADNEAHPDALAHYRENYRDRLEALMHELSAQQLDTLELLLKAERL